MAAYTKVKPYTFWCKAFFAGAIPKEASSTMGLAPLAGTGPLCPDRQTLGGRRNARRRPPEKICSPQAFSKKHRGQRRGETMRRSLPRRKRRDAC